MAEHPPPYVPHPPPAPGVTSVYSTQPSAFPGSPYQTFPQTYAGGGDHGYYQGPPHGHMGGYPGQPGCHGYQSGPPPPHCHGEQPKHTVFVVEQQSRPDDGGGEDSCLAACSAALCCCCLWDMLSHDLC